MSDKIGIGDVCIFQNAQVFHRLNGEEVTVISIGEYGRSTLHGGPYFGYLLDKKLPNGNDWVAMEGQLRKKRPPSTGEKSILALFKPMPQREGVAV